MPCIAGRYNNGLIIQIAVFKDVKSLQNTLSPPQSGQAPRNVKFYSALLDTGATATCISQKVVSDLKLTPIGKAQMISASHVVAANQYLFTVAVPTGLQQQSTGLVSGNFTIFDNLNGLEFAATGSAYDVLLGMDVIRRGSLKIDFDGHFSFCF